MITSGKKEENEVKGNGELWQRSLRMPGNLPGNN